MNKKLYIVIHHRVPRIVTMDTHHWLYDTFREAISNFIWSFARLEFYKLIIPHLYIGVREEQGPLACVQTRCTMSGL